MIAMEHHDIGPDLLLRAAEPDDMPLVCSDWLRSNRDGPVSRLLTDTVYYTETKPIVRALVGLVQPIVACHPERREQVHGWICGERIEGRLVVHFVYVKQAWRGWGIGRRLLGALGYQRGEIIYATHITHLYTGGRLSGRQYRVVNNPWIAIRRAGGMPCF